MRKSLFVLLTVCFLASPAQAAIFDAADILPRNAGAVGAMGEILLSDPTSEGVEAHGRYGLSDDLNLGAILGTGSKNKRFRLGGEAIYNLLPDWQGQVGVSFLGSVLYLNRPTGGGLQMRVGPMVHKRITSWSAHPATFYVALPFYLEANHGTYYSATQLVLGSDFDLTEGGHYYGTGEAGIRLNRADSYVLLGFGIRLGDLKFNRRERAPDDQDLPSQPKRAASEREYSDEDFKK
jgi:hypothetical protein